MSEKKHKHDHDKESLVSEDNLHKMLKSILPLIEKAKQEVNELKEHENEHDGGIHDIMLQPAMMPVSHLSELEDSDFEQGDMFDAFKNDFDGCGGVVKIIKINPDDAFQRISACVEKMDNIKTARRLLEIRKAYQYVKSFAIEQKGSDQVNAVKILEKLLRESETSSDRYAFTKAKNAVLAGEPELIDAAAYRIQNVFANKVPHPNVRIAYFENPRAQDGEDYQLCPKARFQIGYAVPMPISSCRDNCIDSRTTKDGQVSCAYQDWLKHAADNHISAVERLDEVHPQVNAESKMNLEEGERFRENHLAIDAMNFEQRMEEKLRNLKSKSKTKIKLDESIEAKLDNEKIYNGHQGEVENRSMEDRLRKPVVASKHEGIDPEEEVSFGAQLEAKRKKLYVDEQVEQRFEEVSESNLGHHGEPTMRIQDVNVKKAWNQTKNTKLDYTSTDTVNNQLESRHEADLENMETIEELLADAEHYYSDDEMEVLVSTLEELLSKQHKGY